MRFWDSSALVPLVIEQSPSKACRQLLRSDRELAVLCLSRVEVVSALCRLVRNHVIGNADLTTAETRLQRLADRWTEIDILEPVRERAEDLLHRHNLRAADALQLAGALVIVGPRAKGRPFVTLDRTLAEAAGAEGFGVIEPR